MSDDEQRLGEREALVRLLSEQAQTLADRLPVQLTRLSLRAGDCEVAVSCEPNARGDQASAGQAPSYDPAPSPDAADEAGTTVVTAPLVGTFYRAPEPGAAPFVEVGDTVERGQDVAIIEAMKLMNRIEATATGRVAAILAEDQEMVEYGQPLLLIEVDEGEGVADGQA